MTHVTCGLTAKNRDQLTSSGTLRSVIEYGPPLPFYRIVQSWRPRGKVCCLRLPSGVPGMEPIMTPLVRDRVSCCRSVTPTTRTSYVVPDRSPDTLIQFRSVSTALRFHGSISTPSPPSAGRSSQHSPITRYVAVFNRATLCC